MKDSLEKFVNENREDFDVFEPRPELWQKICPHVPPLEQAQERKEAKVIRFNFGERASFVADMLFMRVAAAIILLLGCGLTLYLMKQEVPTAVVGPIAATTTEQPQLQHIAPELVEVEAYYTSQINEKKSQLTTYDLKVLGLDEQQEIDQELARLDSSYTQLKKQLYTTPNTDKVMGAMIQNLQIRIEVLNRQLEVLQRIEKLQQQQKTEPQKNETSNV